MEVKIVREDGIPTINTVKIDSYDTWNCDWTLAQIAAPLFKAFGQDLDSTGKIDKEDVPEELRDTFNEDGFSEQAYKWVIDEVTYAMTEIANDRANEPEVYRDDPTIPRAENDPIGLSQLVQIPGALAAYEAYNKRIQNGCVLLGKYLQTFWD